MQTFVVSFKSNGENYHENGARNRFNLRGDNKTRVAESVPGTVLGASRGRCFRLRSPERSEAAARVALK